jgi:hypothetical protein
MKNAVFWDIKAQFIPHRRYIISKLETSAGYCYVRVEVFTAANMKNSVFWDLSLAALVRTDVSEELSSFIIRGATFLRNIGSYKNHIA